MILTTPPSLMEVRRCNESNDKNERKNRLLLPKKNRIWQTLTLSKSEQAHTHGK
jgi:hypothetical protein